VEFHKDYSQLVEDATSMEEFCNEYKRAYDSDMKYEKKRIFVLNRGITAHQGYKYAEFDEKSVSDIQNEWNKTYW
jgi:hypothetical protein